MNHPGLFQITARHFTAGIITNHKGWVIQVSPIIGKHVPQFCSWSKVEEAMREHGWKLIQVKGEHMAFKRSRGGDRPSHYIAVTAKVGKGKYEKGPYIGLWEGDGERNSPLFRGNTKGKYLDELYTFIKEYGEDEVGFAIFESRGDRGSERRERDDSDRDDSDRGSRRSSRGRDEEEDKPRGKRSTRDEEEKPRGRSSREEESPRGRDKGKSDKKKDWFDD